MGMAIAATALGVFNRVQIEQLKTELFEVKSNVGRLFEVVQDFSSNFSALEAGFNEIRTTLLYQVMFNPTLFDSRLSRLENQLRSRLHRVTHAIQAAMHQRFAIDYLNPAELVQLYGQLAGRAEEAGCELLIQYHSDLFQVKTSLLFDGQDGHILIHVPMAPKGTLLRLFRLHPFPLPMFDTHHIEIDAEDDILAISSSETRYNVQLTSTDLLSCHRMNQVFMCDSFGVMSKRFNDTCLGALYMQRFELVRGLCKFRVIPMKEQVYQVRKGQYLVYSPNTSTATMRCRNGSHSEIHLQRGTQQVKIPAGCQGFFLDHLATSGYSVRLASEVLHFGWDWDPLTLLPAGDIADMGRMLKNMSDLHLHHPDLLELQYITRQNGSSSDIGRLDLGLQGLSSSVSSYFASFGTSMGATIILILVGLSYLNCRHGESAQPTSSPIVVQAPAPAPASNLVILQAGSPSAPLLPAPLEPTRTHRRQRRRRGRSCCEKGDSDEDFSVRYRTDQEELEMLRDRYAYDNCPGTDPRSYRKPFGKMPAEDSGTDSPSHVELQDRLRSFLG